MSQQQQEEQQQESGSQAQKVVLIKEDEEKDEGLKSHAHSKPAVHQRNPHHIKITKTDSFPSVFKPSRSRSLSSASTSSPTTTASGTPHQSLSVEETLMTSNVIRVLCDEATGCVSAIGRASSSSSTIPLYKILPTIAPSLPSFKVYIPLSSLYCLFFFLFQIHSSIILSLF